MRRAPPVILTLVAIGAGARAQPVPDPNAPAAEVPEQGLVVTGTRTPRRVTDDPVGTERIGAKELSARNVRDASRALEAEPGIQTERSFRGSSFQLRGLDAKYVRILVDGQPVMGQVNDVIDLRRYAIESVERVEIVRGASSALYGSDALAGVVNFISRRPKRALEAGGFAQYGQLNQSLVGATVGGKRGDYAGTLSLNWFGNNSYDLTPGNENLQTNGDARRAFTATARGFWNPDDRIEALAFVRGGYFDSRGVDLQPPRALFNRVVDEAEGATGAQLSWKVDDATRVAAYVQANLFARAFEREQRQTDYAEKIRSAESLLRGELQLDRKVAEGVELTIGSGGQRGTFESPRIEGGYGAVASGWVFVQAGLDAGRVLNLVAGGRLDLDGQFGSHVSPRIAARLKLDALAEGLSLRASYGEGFRAPSFGERYYAFHNQVANYVVYGNPALTPEVSASVQAGVEYVPKTLSFGGGYAPTLRLTGHRTGLDGLIQATEMTDSSAIERRYAYTNYKSARFQGIEAGLRITKGDRFVADVGYAWLDTVATLRLETGVDVTRGLPGRAGRQLTCGVMFTSEDGAWEVSARAAGLARRTSLLDDSLLDAIVLADAKVARRLWKADKARSELQLYVSGDNLADVTEPDFLSLPGRLFAVGLNARY